MTWECKGLCGPASGSPSAWLCHPCLPEPEMLKPSATHMPLWVLKLWLRLSCMRPPLRWWSCPVSQEPNNVPVFLPSTAPNSGGPQEKPGRPLAGRGKQWPLCSGGRVRAAGGAAARTRWLGPTGSPRWPGRWPGPQHPHGPRGLLQLVGVLGRVHVCLRDNGRPLVLRAICLIKLRGGESQMQVPVCSCSPPCHI